MINQFNSFSSGNTKIKINKIEHKNSSITINSSTNTNPTNIQGNFSSNIQNNFSSNIQNNSQIEPEELNFDEYLNEINNTITQEQVKESINQIFEANREISKSFNNQLYNSVINDMLNQVGGDSNG